MFVAQFLWQLAASSPPRFGGSAPGELCVVLPERFEEEVHVEALDARIHVDLRGCTKDHPRFLMKAGSGNDHGEIWQRKQLISHSKNHSQHHWHFYRLNNRKLKHLLDSTASK